METSSIHQEQSLPAFFFLYLVASDQKVHNLVRMLELLEAFPSSVAYSSLSPCIKNALILKKKKSSEKSFLIIYIRVDIFLKCWLIFVIKCIWNIKIEDQSIFLSHQIRSPCFPFKNWNGSCFGSCIVM